MQAREYKRKMMREWRARKKNHLDVLRTKANAEDATIREISEYTEAFNKRKYFLEKERARVKLYRQKLEQKYSQYDSAALKQHSNQDRVAKKLSTDKVKSKKQKQNQRNRIRLSVIKTKLSSGQNINNQWVKFHKMVLTPLGSCIKTNNLIGVKFLLNSKASPIAATYSNGPKPLDEAAWLGFSDILCCLLEHGAIGNDGLTYGALHGAIHKKLFTAVKTLILHNCDVNETYCGGTPLRAALTCGRSNSGDVRMVNILLRAKAAVDIQTVRGIHTFSPDFRKTSHIELARMYSNVKCVQAILRAM